MQAGELVDGRFEVERLAGAGGMGAVYLARDRSRGGAQVALKVLLGGNGTPGSLEADRFAREADVLAAIDHPGVVRFVGRGRTAAGEAWLAMQWLEGHDLAHELSQRGGALAAGEAVARVREAAEALAAAHERGVVHRDLKPSNLFLARDEASAGGRTRVVLLDFGVARQGARGATRTGMALGTPGYMAPEQVRGVAELDTRADVFSLGCVLFECIAGRLPFEGAHPVAVLSKILTEDAPRLSSVCPGVPDALDALVAAMTARDPSRRPLDAAALLPTLRALEADAPSWASSAASTAPAISQRSLALVSVVLATRVDASGALPPSVRPAAMGAGATVQLDEQPDPVDGACAIARAHGASACVLPDGSMLAAFASSAGSLDGASATDLAARAADCASAVSTVLPVSMAVAVATGRADTARSGIVGEAIDRATELLRVPGGAPRVVRMDPVTARLLEGRAALTPPTVRGTARAALRALVGRDRELRRLDDLRDESLEESRARVALLVGPAGAGKTRLAAAFLDRAQTAGAFCVAVRVSDRDEPGALGLATALVGAALDAEGLRLTGAPCERAVRELESHLARLAPFEGPLRDGRGRWALAQLAGLGASSSVRADEGAAWQGLEDDPAWRAETLSAAFEAWFSAWCAAHDEGLVLVLDELERADEGSVRLLERGLRAARERSVCVLACARPSLLERNPGLWSDREPQVLRIGELPRRAAEQLTRALCEARGLARDPDSVRALVDRAGGLPLCIDALCNVAAPGEGRAEEAARAVLHARIAGLSPDVSRAIRAASVYGSQCWPSAVGALLGGDATADVCARGALAALCEGEWLEAEPRSRFAAHDALRFRVGLAREAAYASLTDGDRQLAHREAARWLEATGEPDAHVLAEHYERAGEASRAVPLFVRAAEQAVTRGDAECALRYTARARSLGADGAQLARVRAISCEAHAARGHATVALEEGVEAVAALDAGDPAWGRAVFAATWAAHVEGDDARLVQLAEALRTHEPANESAVSHARATAYACAMLASRRTSSACAQLAAAQARRLSERRAPVFKALRAEAELAAARAREDLSMELACAQRACDAWHDAGATGHEARARLELGVALLWAGDWTRALSSLQAAWSLATSVDRGRTAACAQAMLAFGAWQLGDRAAAAMRAREAVAALDENPPHTDPLVPHGALARALATHVRLLARDGVASEHRGALDRAIAEAHTPLERVAPLVLRARHHLLASGPEGPVLALRDSTDALAALRSGEGAEAFTAWTAAAYLAHTDARLAAGDAESARATLAAGRAALELRIATIADPVLRERHVRGVPEHVRLLDTTLTHPGARRS